MTYAPGLDPSSIGFWMMVGTIAASAIAKDGGWLFVRSEDGYYQSLPGWIFTKKKYVQGRKVYRYRWPL